MRRYWIGLFLAFNSIIAGLSYLAYDKMLSISLSSQVAVLTAGFETTFTKLTSSYPVSMPSNNESQRFNSLLKRGATALGEGVEYLVVQRKAGKCQIINQTVSRQINTMQGLIDCEPGMLKTFATGSSEGRYKTSYRDVTVHYIARRFALTSKHGQKKYILWVEIDDAVFGREVTEFRNKLLLICALLAGLSLLFCLWGSRSQHRHRQSAAEARVTLDNASSGMCRADMDGKFTMINPGMTDLFGYAESELIGKDVGIIIPTEFKKAHDQGWGRMKRGEPATILGKKSRTAIEAQRKDGSIFPAQLNVTKAEFPGGTEILGVFVDMTESEADKQEIQAQNEELTMMAKITRHDLLNHMGVVKSSLDLIEVLGFDEELFKTAQNENDVGIEFIQSVSKYQKLSAKGREGLEIETISLDELISQIKPEGAKFTIGDLGEIKCDVGFIKPAIRNLLENSIRHCEELPEISINREGNVLHIIDNAGGFACVEGEYNEDYASRLAQPGQQGNTQADGTGMGLASCIRTFKAHGFKFRHKTTCGKGTHWSITIK